MNKHEKNVKPLKGVRCDAINCEFNTGDGECGAKQISIGPIYADSCTDTVCASFNLRRAENGENDG